MPRKKFGRNRKNRCRFCTAEGCPRPAYVDYKDVALLERCVSDRSKIRARRSSGNDVGKQREIERAVKNAREMALLPYAKQVETKRRLPRGRSAAATTAEIDETE